MPSRELVETVGYCGLICEGCSNTKKPPEPCQGCRRGGGDADCYQRRCCLEKGIDGCWQCDSSPCGKGFFDPSNEAWSGLCRGFIQCIKDKGIEEFVMLVQSKLGKTIEYGDLRFKKEDEIVRLLVGTC